MIATRLLRVIDQISYWSGKTFAWLILALTFVVSIEVFKRYILNAPTAWIFDLNNMLYGTLFMMCGAYTLSKDGHVRGDFLYGSMKPRTQASLDLVLYIVFFLPGVGALTLAGWDYFNSSYAMRETTFNATPLPLYPFILDGVAQDPALNQGDGIHPNPKGAQIVADKLLPFVTKNLDDAPPVHRPARP